MAYFISVNIFKTKNERDGTVCEKFHRVTLFNDALTTFGIEEIYSHSLTHTTIHTTHSQSNKRKTARLISYLFSFVKCRL